MLFSDYHHTSDLESDIAFIKQSYKLYLDQANSIKKGNCDSLFYYLFICSPRSWTGLTVRKPNVIVGSPQNLSMWPDFLFIFYEQLLQLLITSMLISAKAAIVYKVAGDSPN